MQQFWNADVKELTTVWCFRIWSCAGAGSIHALRRSTRWIVISNRIRCMYLWSTRENACLLYALYKVFVIRGVNPVEVVTFLSVSYSSFHISQHFPFRVFVAQFTMLSKQFYFSVVSSEGGWINFLQEHALIGEPGYHNLCHKYCIEMSQKQRKNRSEEWVPVLRCPKKDARRHKLGRKVCFFSTLSWMNALILIWCCVK